MGFNDRRNGEMTGWESPATRAKAVTVSDTTIDPNLYGSCFRGLWVGAAGNVKVTTLDGDEATFIGVAAGTLIPIACTRVWSTGTTVATPNTNILGLS